MKKLRFIFALLVILILISDFVYGQCAMCKATIETDASDVGKGVNNAILYIMVMPYILLALIAFVFYRKKNYGKV